MRFIRQAYRTFALVSGLSFIHARFSVPAGASFASVLVSVIIWSLSPLAGEIARLLQYDEVIYMASGFVWLALNFRELEQTGASFSWWKAICGLAGTTCAFGPGAAFAFGWDRREGILDRMSSYNRSQ